MRALVAVLLLSTCHSPPGSTPAGPEGEKAAAALDRAGIKVHSVEGMPGLEETPGCPEAQSRFRLTFGPSEFVNVSRFSSEAKARSCFDEYRSQVIKGGQVAWDRLAPLAVLDGPRLFLFAETVSDPGLRSRVVEALRAAPP